VVNRHKSGLIATLSMRCSHTVHCLLFTELLTPVRNAYYLSFPVVLGAVLSNRLAARLSDVEPVHWATPIVLALSVFIIYTIDRLLDIHKPEQPPTPRHLFHRQHSVLLWQVVAGAALLAGGLVFFLPASVVKFGIALAGICAAYVLAVYRLPTGNVLLRLKEPMIALLYSVGVWGSVWVQRPKISGIEIAEFLMFLGIASQNLILFDMMEHRESTARPESSVVTAWGMARADTALRWLTLGILATGFVLCFVTDDRFAERSAIMLALMSLVLYVIQQYPAYFIKNERYRWLGDAIFWMPALVL